VKPQLSDQPKFVADDDLKIKNEASQNPNPQNLLLMITWS